MGSSYDWKPTMPLVFFNYIIALCSRRRSRAAIEPSPKERAHIGLPPGVPSIIIDIGAHNG